MKGKYNLKADNNNSLKGVNPLNMKGKYNSRTLTIIKRMV